jgi:hypothetical protein
MVGRSNAESLYTLFYRLVAGWGLTLSLEGIGATALLSGDIAEETLIPSLFISSGVPHLPHFCANGLASAQPL